MPHTSVDGQRADAAAPARRARRPVCSARRSESRAPRRDVSERRSTRGIARRIVIAVVLATAGVMVVLALPPLRRVGEQISRMSLAWIGGAVMLEIASCAAYVVIFRLFFAEVPADLARRVAWTEEGSGALLPTGGLGALAIGGWLLREAGMSTQRIVESSSALFFLTSGTNIVGLIGGGVLLCSDASGGRDTLLLAGAPILLGVGATFATLALPVVLRRSLLRRWPSWLVNVSAGIEAACRSLLSPSWRVAGRGRVPRL